jgi:hypothetical protein
MRCNQTPSPLGRRSALDVHLTDDEIRTLEEPYGPHVPTAF